jgi:hypothetical protein
MAPNPDSRWQRLLAAARCAPAAPPEPAPPGLATAVVARWRAARPEPLDEWLALFGRRVLCACALFFITSLGLAGWQAASASPLTAWIETNLVPELPLP